MGGAAGVVDLLQLLVHAVVLAELVDGAHVIGVAEVEGLGLEGAREQLDGAGEDIDQNGALVRGVLRQEQAEVLEDGFHLGGVVEAARRQELEVGEVKRLGQGLDAAKVQDAELVAGRDEEVARVRVGVELAQFVHLEVVEIPDGLADAVAQFRRRAGLGEAVQGLPVDPVHRDDALGGEFGVVARKHGVGQRARGFAESHRALQLQRVVGFFKEAFLDLGEEVLHLARAQVEEAGGEGLEQAQVREEAVGHAGVLDLDGKGLLAAGGAVHLPDGGGVDGVAREGVEDLVGSLAKGAAKGLHDQRVGQRRGRVLRL